MNDAAFDYLAIDVYGQRTEGRLEAPGFSEALAILRERNWRVLKIKQSDKLKRRWSDIFFSSSRPSISDIEQGFALLARLIASGIDLLESLNILMVSTDKPSTARWWKKVSEKVRDGSALTEGLAQAKLPKQKMILELLKIGETTGRLNEVLATVSENLERSRATKARLLGALLYPVIVFLFTIAAAIIAIYFLLPKLEMLIGVMGRSVHPLTRFMMDGGELLRLAAPWILLLSALVTTALILFWKSSSGRLYLDKRLLHIPIIGSLLRIYYSAELARNLGLMQESGIRLTEAISHSASAMSNLYLSSILDKTWRALERGMTLSEPMSVPHGFTSLFLSMLSIGEKSGTIDEVMQDVSKIHFEALEKGIKSFSVVISGFMVVFVGLVISLLYASILLTYFS